jgi:phosphonate transport system ATP-binding protein
MTFDLAEKSRLQAVRIAGAGVKFGGVQAVAPATFSVSVGESVALLGPSGAGKTTMLRLIGGEVKPSTGQVDLMGRSISTLQSGRELASTVGMVHQQFDLVPNLSALQNTLVGNLARWGLARSLVSLIIPLERRTALAALTRVGIGDKADLRARQLSGGEQQRVAIARVLVQDPAIVLADEPVASLDPSRARETLGILVGEAGERPRTLVASMHSVELARDYFDRFIGLRNGEIMFDSPSRDVRDDMLEKLYRIEGLRLEA